MAKKRAKCILCGKNLKGNEWQWFIDSDGIEHEEKVCRNERACQNRQRRQKEIYEVPQEAKELEEQAVITPEKLVIDTKKTDIGNYTRRYLEVLVAVLTFVLSVVMFYFANKGGV